VVAGDVDEAAARRTAETIRSRGGVADPVRLDVRSSDEIRGVLERHGTPDALVSTPGINVRKRITEVSDDEFDRVIDVNLKGTFRLAREVGRRMAERGSGSIVAFSSIRAQVVEPGQGVYAATKAGIVQLLRALAAELGPRGVRANAIAPGVVETPLTAPIKSNPAWYRAYADRSVFHRWARADEIAGTVVFLCSDASSYVTGACIFVDGGWTATDGRFDPPL
jgi:NAD(P)-dependent dehydrogenase (short-subunit alcohol dehydrogenase family)